MHTYGFMQRIPASEYRTIVSTSRVSVHKARRRREDTHRSVSTQLCTKPRTFRSYVSAFPRCFLTRISCERARVGAGVTRYDGCTAATDVTHRRARAIFASLTARMLRAHRLRNCHRRPQCASTTAARVQVARHRRAAASEEEEEGTNRRRGTRSSRARDTRNGEPAPVP